MPWKFMSLRYWQCRPWENNQGRGRVIISFTDEYMEHVTNPHEDMLVITVKINIFDVKRIMVESRSSTSMLFLDALLWGRHDLKKVNRLLPNLICGKYRLASCANQTPPWCWVKGKKVLKMDIVILVVDTLKKIRFQIYVVNSIVVKKSTWKSRMCIDFRAMKKVCPVDSYPLPNINQLVDAKSVNIWPDPNMGRVRVSKIKGRVKIVLTCPTR